MSKAQVVSLCMWMVQVTLAFLILFFFLYLAVRPSDPAYTIVAFSASGPNFTFGLDISNNNNIHGDVRFGDLILNLCAADRFVGGTTLPGPFYLPHGRSVQWWETLACSGGNANDGYWDRLDVVLATVVRYRILAWQTPPSHVRLVGAVTIDGDEDSSSSSTVTLRPIKRKWRVKI